MDFNPLTEECARLQKQIDELQQREKHVAAELEWYRGIDRTALAEDLRQSEEAAGRLRTQVQALDAEIPGLRSQLADIEAQVFSWWNPRNWLATDQAERRRNRDRLQDRLGQQTAERQARGTELGVTAARITRIQADLLRHQSFNLQQQQAELSNTRTQIASRRAELEPLAERKRHIDEILAPLLHQLRNLDERRRQAESDLAVAQRLEQRLSSATNTYEKAMIHQECAGTFKDERPKRVEPVSKLVLT